jgi:hypothetical protein
MLYFPDRLPKGKSPARKYLFDVLNTIRTDYVQNLIAYANYQRFTAN